MTKSRISVDREIVGILGKFPNRSELLKQWNTYFREEGIDASAIYYPTTVENLPERLSEMFHFDRRLYLVSPNLQEVIAPLLDRIDEEPVEVIWNDGGVLVGRKMHENLLKQIVIIFG